MVNLKRVSGQYNWSKNAAIAQNNLFDNPAFLANTGQPWRYSNPLEMDNPERKF